VTSAEPSPTTTSTSESSGPDSALCAALTTEHAVIYGYGIVSAHSPPDVNSLVTYALNQHRERRDQVIAMLAGRSVSAPVAAAGYQLPMPVNNATDAARLAVRMENDTEVAWRAVIEQAQTSQDREFGVTALSQSAVLAARWNQVLNVWPITTAFPGGQ
jgi:phosphoribosylcarboxyaminoimidazole (NCAIR) mutase